MQNSTNLNDYYILDKTDINKFWVNGFIHLKNVLSKNEINFFFMEFMAISTQLSTLPEFSP